jgi:hypothetical protein
VATTGTTAGARALEREWWSRAWLVLVSPRAVFDAFRDDSDAAAQARQEPVLALVLLAGIAGVLSTGIAGELLDDPEFDALLIAIWALLGGIVYGVALYFVAGGLLYLGQSFAGGLGSYRQARHVLAYAAVPLAVSLVIWPVRLALHGEDVFRTGGTDEGAGGAVFDALEGVFVVWSVALLVVGVRVVRGWTWARALAAAALPALLPALALARAYGAL